MTNLPPDHDALVAGLRTQAHGVYAAEAAVELLIAHGAWLRRTDFRHELVDGPRGDFAWIDWHRIPEFLEHAGCSGSEARILALAAELVGVDTGRGLDELLSPTFDDVNRRLVLDTVAHTLNLPAGSRPERTVDRLVADVVDVFGPGEAQLPVDDVRARLAQADPGVYSGWSTRRLTAALRRRHVGVISMAPPGRPPGDLTICEGVVRQRALEALARHSRAGETR